MQQLRGGWISGRGWRFPGVLLRRSWRRCLSHPAASTSSPRQVFTNYNLPLTVLLRLDPSIGAAAALDYHDACAQSAVLAIHEPLAAELKSEWSRCSSGS